MLLDHDSCYEAIRARDPRFDGVLYVGVKTTGVYCRPVCPANTPRRDRCQFFANAAAAENAGFRPCLRCRPELAPGNAVIDSANRIASSAARRIEAGALNEAGIDELAAEFGVSSRQLRRVVKRELGVTPTELAQTQRLLLAKHLLTDSALPAIEIAFASGFSSVRQFNAIFHKRYGLSPTALRRSQDSKNAGQALTVRLDFRPPMAWQWLLKFLAGRAIPGVESVEDNRYWRAIQIGAGKDACAHKGQKGWIIVERVEGADALHVEVSLSLARRLPSLLARVKNLFDLDAHPQLIEARLCEDERLRETVSRRSGLRLPGAFDGFEMAMRAVLGQQISVAAARTIAGRITEAFAEPVETPNPRLNRASVSAASLSQAGVADLTRLGLTGKRAECLIALARAVAEGEIKLVPGADAEATIDRLKQIPGVGDWTAHYIAMRALRWPDAFPHSDLGLRKALGETSSKRILEIAEKWRPWRAYALMHLWSH
ncbi:MAG TPA: AlkA N-terminal domain-containing protein [Blastocatellia bacterium]|jgi:AraC family transcriptional regulator of adaptative response / DNA-3-methyladenine glycosylase II|nr:AlkA N-terminal domain-containing protein [Blastocatellia bacterium]